MAVWGVEEEFAKYSTKHAKKTFAWVVNRTKYKRSVYKYVNKGSYGSYKVEEIYVYVICALFLALIN